MKCSKCNCYLSPEEKDLVLQALAEGIKQKPVCNDCIESAYEEFMGDEDDDDIYFDNEPIQRIN